MVHDGAGERAADGGGGGGAGAVGRAHVFLAEVVDDVDGFGGCEQRGAGAVAEEAQVAVVGDDVHGRVPGYLRGGRGSWSHVVHRADVAAVEAQARSRAEHSFVGRVERG